MCSTQDIEKSYLIDVQLLEVLVTKDKFKRKQMIKHKINEEHNIHDHRTPNIEGVKHRKYVEQYRV